MTLIFISLFGILFALLGLGIGIGLSLAATGIILTFCFTDIPTGILIAQHTLTFCRTPISFPCPSSS